MKFWSRYKYMLAILIVFIFVGIVIVTGNHSSNSLVPTPTSKPISDIYFMDIQSYHDQNTDLAWNDYLDGIKGMRVRWTGYVDDVAKDVLGTNYVWVCVDSIKCDLDGKAYFSYPVDKARSLKKGQKVAFEGDIASASGVLGFDIGLNNGDIINP